MTRWAAKVGGGGPRARAQRTIEAEGVLVVVHRPPGTAAGAARPVARGLPAIGNARDSRAGPAILAYLQEIAASSKKALTKSRGLTLEPATSRHSCRGNS